MKEFLKITFQRYFNKFYNRLNPVPNPGGGEFEIDNYLLSRFIVFELLPIVGFTPFPLNELLLMTGTVCRLRPNILLEWGTHVGKSARIFSETSNMFNLGIQIHSIDLPDHIAHVEHPGNQRGKYVKTKYNVHLYQGDGLEKAHEIISSLGLNQNILFFLDGDHSFDSVFSELTTIMTKYPNANILVHDTFFQSDSSMYNIGPYKAIQSALQVLPNSFHIISMNTGLPGMTLLFH